MLTEAPLSTMAPILTKRQAEELHKAMVGYLSSINASKSIDALREELGISESFTESSVKKYEGLLERKWTSNARLQRKIMDLESQLITLQSQLPHPKSASKRDPKTWLPGTATYTLQSHRSAINDIAIHPVHSILASASDDSSIKIWDYEHGELEKTLRGHLRSTNGVDFGGTRDKTVLASCSSDLTIKIWDPANGYANVRTLTGHEHSVSSVRFLQEGGNLLVSVSRDESIRIWNVESGFCVKVTHAGDWVYAVSPSVDGKWLVSGGRDRVATISDVGSGGVRAALDGHENYVECCVFAPVASYGYLAKMAGTKRPEGLGEFVATGSRDKSIRLWDSRGGLIKTLDGHENWVRGLAFHPAGRYLLSVGDDGTMRCWDLEQEGRLVRTTEGHGGFVSCIRWAPSAVEADALGTVNGVGKGIRCAVATGCTDSRVRVFR
ncbi:nuclear migration protein NudF [Penicillium cinerascens]|uniref:Nuclear distribution protein nudF n=1 Tax=Penicillium cinerascens TaxID=70096 RepID=A0A9W9N3I6_9EURO|nr:nuclear migration protein NudF [Penicillium cinerascens]KAJ5212504.1 nuclear migration protein NudF [Penicillium cinerascens]